VQGTQRPAPTSHEGAAPEHAETFEAEHWPQAPFGWQAGVDPPQSASLAQARHACVEPSQAGVVPLHWALDVHATQTPDGVWQSGV
jgi:hypothetical protein